jgi:ATP synthase protein I
VADPRRTLRKAGSWVNLTAVGLQFPIAIVLGYLWGRWLDRWLGTHPWLTVVFSLFGIVAGFVNLFRMTSRLEDEDGGGDGPRADDPPPDGK